MYIYIYIYYLNFIILICDVFMMASTLCSGRCYALLNITECDAASCVHVDCHLLDYTTTLYCCPTNIYTCLPP